MTAIAPKPLPDAIRARDPFPETAQIEDMFARGILPGGSTYLSRRSAGTDRTREPVSRHTSWTVDDVTISAVALLNDDILDAIAETLTPQTPNTQIIAACGPYAAHPPLAHLWRGIETIEIHAFAMSHVMAAIRFDRAAGGDVVYADGALAIGGDVPETVRLAALGTDMQGLLPHPVFFAHRWQKEQRDRMLLNGPESCRRLGSQPGLQLVRLARADRESLLQAGAELGLTGERSPDARLPEEGGVAHPLRRDDDPID